MINELYYTPIDIAAIICSMDLKCNKENEFINFIWDNEKFYIKPDFRENKRKFILDIFYWTDYIYNKQIIDYEFPAIQEDLHSIGSNCSENDYISDFSNIDLFFKSLRLKIRLSSDKKYRRIKLRTLLRKYGYLRRSSKLMNYIKNCIDFYGIKIFLKGGVECDINKIDIDEMIVFRLYEDD